MQKNIIKFMEKIGVTSSYLLGGLGPLGCFGARAPSLNGFDPPGCLAPEPLCSPPGMFDMVDFPDINCYLLICK